MGFCRRCGDIVSGERCKCGGTAVAPVVSWKEHDAEGQDKWSRTYVLRDRSASSASVSPVKQYRKNAATTASIDLSARISAHIAASASSNPRSDFPLRPAPTGPLPEAGVLPSPGDSTLAKVYGSVLQPSESLASFACVLCNAVFPPDATIYPDPRSPDAASEDRFLCRPCFVANGGSKGTCPSCSRPVLILKSEGGFIHAADKYWHKRCFTCDGCRKNIGDSPMVDLLGRPSCPDCFDSCLRRGCDREGEPSTPIKRGKLGTQIPLSGRNMGGMDTSPAVTVGLGLRGLEASPGLEELEHRLGVVGSTREGSPSLEELSQRLITIGKDSPRARRDSRHSERYKSPEPEDLFDSPERTSGLRLSGGTPSPTRGLSTSRSDSPAPTPEAIKEMKSRFMRSMSISSPPPTTSPLNQLAQSFSTASSSKVPRSPAATRTSVGSRLPVLTSPQAQLHTKHSQQEGGPFGPSSACSSSNTPTPDLPDTMVQLTPPKMAPTDRRCAKIEQAGKLPVSRDYGESVGPDPIPLIMEEPESQLATPVHTPNKDDPKATPPSRIPVASWSPKVKGPALTPITLPARPLGTDELTSSVRCAKCAGLLFSTKGGGKYLTIPGEGGAKENAYHVECFRCTICQGVFKEGGKGQAIFVKFEGNPCHVECTPPEKYTIRKSRSFSELRSGYAQGTAPVIRNAPEAPKRTYAPPGGSVNTNGTYSSSRYERHFPLQPTSSDSGKFRFGSRTACPGCNMSVSPMERGVVPGPQGTRWHAACLVCGGKNKKGTALQWSATWMIGRGGGSADERRRKGVVGCGKKLDSAAKTDGEGGVWCRECLLLLATPSSPTKPLVPCATGLPTKGVTAQSTGTTLARQFTGIGSIGDTGKESGLLRQLTGGGLSPTRSMSPTKQLGMIGASGRPRPKSVIGMRSTKSIDEGRGMFLVRQMTGNGSFSHVG